MRWHLAGLGAFVALGCGGTPARPPSEGALDALRGYLAEHVGAPERWDDALEQVERLRRALEALAAESGAGRARIRALSRDREVDEDALRARLDEDRRARRRLLDELVDAHGGLVAATPAAAWPGAARREAALIRAYEAGFMAERA